jgi:hypothetical protein
MRPKRDFALGKRLGYAADAVMSRNGTVSVDSLGGNATIRRVPHGSDLAVRDPRHQLGWVLFSRLPAAAKARMLGQNALRVLAPCLERQPAVNRPSVTAKLP